jgi:hypothetical protein
MKTLYRSEEGDAAEEWPLCDGCYGEVADEVLLVADPAYCFGTCRACGDEWFSVRELSETAGGDATPPLSASASCATGARKRGTARWLREPRTWSRSRVSGMRRGYVYAGARDVVSTRMLLTAR